MAISSFPTYRADIITESQAKGLGNFVSKFALPALLFKNMVLLDFGDVIWAFLWSVLVAKVGVCASACVVLLLHYVYVRKWSISCGSRVRWCCWLVCCKEPNKWTRPYSDAPILCVGDGVCAGMCAHSDGGQSRQQIQQGWPVRHLRYAEQWLRLRIPYRWSRHKALTLMYIPPRDSQWRYVFFKKRLKEDAFLSLFLSVSLFVVDALYRSTYPEYLQYIYLVAPVSLMLLNPIGFAFCEVQKWRQASHSQHSTLGILGVVVLQVLYMQVFLRWKTNHSECNTPLQLIFLYLINFKLDLKLLPTGF